MGIRDKDQAPKPTLGKHPSTNRRVTVVRAKAKIRVKLEASKK